MKAMKARAAAVLAATTLLGACATATYVAQLRTEVPTIPGTVTRVPLRAGVLVSDSVRSFSYRATIPLGEWIYPFGRDLEDASVRAFAQVFDAAAPVRSRDFQNFDLIIEPRFLESRTNVSIALTRVDVVVGLAFHVYGPHGTLWQKEFTGSVTTGGQTSEQHVQGQALAKAVYEAALTMRDEMGSREFLAKARPRPQAPPASPPALGAGRQPAGAQGFFDGPRAWLGVVVQPLTPELAKSVGAKDAKGVFINDLVADGPAATGGLQKGDILLEFDGRRIEAPADLQRAVGLSKPGQSVWLKVWRDRSERTIGLHLGTAPETPPTAAQAPRDPARAAPPTASAPAPPEREAAAQPASAGSGFLLRNTNLVLTNNHVVEGKTRITVGFPSGEEYPGRVVLRDRSNDLALVEAQGRPTSGGGLVLAVNAEIRVGDTLHALGYPLGRDLSRQPSMVSGAVSSVVGLGDDISRFRTTAPINPGNSGGPLVNQRGQVIGIAAAGLVRQAVEAIRFGIKASTAALILQQGRATTAFDVVVTPAPLSARSPAEIFEEVAPHVVLIEAQ